MEFNVEFERNVHLRGVLDTQLSFVDHHVEPTVREGKIVILGSKTKGIFDIEQSYWSRTKFLDLRSLNWGIGPRYGEMRWR